MSTPYEQVNQHQQVLSPRALSRPYQANVRGSPVDFEGCAFPQVSRRISRQQILTTCVH